MPPVLLIDEVQRRALRFCANASGVPRFSTGTCPPRNTVPWYTAGRNPEAYAWGPDFVAPSLITTNAGRFWLSEPSPYTTHDPRHG